MDPGLDPHIVYTRSNGSRLYLSEWSKANDVEWLEQRNITAIVNVTKTLKNTWEPNGLPTTSSEFIKIKYLKVPIEDSVEGAQRLEVHGFALLDNATRWIDQRSREGRNVLIHCKSGKNRSATAMIAFLIKYERGEEEHGFDYYYHFVARMASRRTDPKTGGPLSILSFDRGVGTFESPQAFKDMLVRYEKYLFGGYEEEIDDPGRRRRSSRIKDKKRPRIEDSIFVF